MAQQARIVGDGPVIMVDDNGTDAYLAQRCYERSGLANQFVHIYSGEGLLDHLNRVEAGEEPMPGLVLLDINMPGTDGFSALTTVRAKPDFQEIPIIAMLTTSDDDKDVAKSRELGANAYFTKPSDISEFVSFFRSLAA